METFTPHFVMLSINSRWEEIIRLKLKLRDLSIEHWLTETLFSFNWWLLLISSLIFFIIWIKLLDKRRIIEISAFGLLIGTITFLLDIIGVSLVAWSYPDQLIPLINSIFEIHKIHLPIIYMIIYQYYNTWKSFLIALMVSSFVFSFILEPITVWLGIYEIYHWNYLYSFPIYIVGGILIRWAILKVKVIEKNA
ncbi:CBO0543 family protein [Bacillus sp. AK128]